MGFCKFCDISLSIAVQALAYMLPLHHIQEFSLTFFGLT